MITAEMLETLRGAKNRSSYIMRRVSVLMRQGQDRKAAFHAAKAEIDEISENYHLEAD